MQKHRQHNLSQNMQSLSDPLVLSSISPDDDDPDVDALLEQYNFEYILAQAKYAYRGVPEEELKDIAQEVHISFWRKLQKGSVENPKAYIARMIRNRDIDGIRRRKHSGLQTLPPLSYQDALECDMANLSDESVADPAEALEQKLAVVWCLKKIVEVLPDLPPRQQHAMACFLMEMADDFPQLIEVFQAHNIDVRLIRWPEDKADKQLLKASLYAARLFMAGRLHIDVSLHRRKQHRVSVTFSSCNNISSR